ncbi:hypothetical protein PIB30_018798 [Stylosanthes scabra]|uniref:Sulfotransferase n=1 Tax=Stylosanthes scabra TaxID=79078 RepID=A0ABU6R8C9_9FABA|nr:hypothetical protein [Stylosanthes scabra]
MEARNEKPPTNLPKPQQPYENLSQEFKNLISTLPTDEGWFSSTIPIYQYQGFWFEAKILQGILTCQKHFEANDTDIILVTAPKSGTTWLKALTFALLNRNKYPPTQEDNPLLVTNPHTLVPFLPNLFCDEKFIIPNPSQYPSPRILSTHVPFVLLPKGRNSHGPFWDHVLEYWKESLEKPEKVMFLSFDNLRNLKVNQTGTIPTTMGFELQNKSFFRRGKIGDSKNFLTPEMIEKINTITEMKLAQHGLRF